MEDKLFDQLPEYIQDMILEKGCLLEHLIEEGIIGWREWIDIISNENLDMTVYETMTRYDQIRSPEAIYKALEIGHIDERNAITLMMINKVLIQFELGYYKYMKIIDSIVNSSNTANHTKLFYIMGFPYGMTNSEIREKIMGDKSFDRYFFIEEIISNTRHALERKNPRHPEEDPIVNKELVNYLIDTINKVDDKYNKPLTDYSIDMFTIIIRDFLVSMSDEEKDKCSRSLAKIIRLARG